MSSNHTQVNIFTEIICYKISVNIDIRETQAERMKENKDKGFYSFYIASMCFTDNTSTPPTILNIKQKHLYWAGVAVPTFLVYLSLSINVHVTHERTTFILPFFGFCSLATSM